MRIGKWLGTCGVLLAMTGCENLTDQAPAPAGPTALAPTGHGSACDHASPRAPWTAEECYDPAIDAADFANVDETNTFFPLIPGTTWRYEAETKDGAEVIAVEVTSDVKTIHLPDGGTIEATVVLDRVYECDELEDCELIQENLVEETYDWYAQDTEGNVWYFGEESTEFVEGVPVNMEGSWEAYVDGALPGIIMFADPKIGTTYRQEYYAGEAEDLARVVSLNRSVSVPYDDFNGCLKTQDWNPLEKATQEQKFYCPDVGLALEVAKQNVRVELVEFATP